ncbi:MAG: hypothetical protein KME55_16655 [Nostoc indistinguendum CM1-VF10]|nr:hypothetical protein [Nostoc indistinguendum CM1-VF10]
MYPSDAIIISEEEATTQLVQVKQAVEAIECIPHSEYPPQLFFVPDNFDSPLPEEILNSFEGK